MRLQKQQCGGQVMIEAVVAISIALTGLLSIIFLLTNSVGVNRAVGEKLAGTYLAAEGIEIVKGILDESLANKVNSDGNLCGNWFEKFVNDPAGEKYQLQYDCTDIKTKGLDPACEQLNNADSNTHLKFSDITFTYNYTEGNDTPFIRTIQVIPKSDTSITDGSGHPPQEAQIISTVQWGASAGVQTVQLEDHFFDWRGVGIAQCL